MIRALTVDDAAAFRALRLEMVQICPTFFSPTEEEVLALTEADCAARIAAFPDDVGFGAFAEGGLRACARFSRRKTAKTRHRAEMSAVYVQPAYRGSGLGLAVVEAVIAHARETGCEIVEASVQANNVTALDLYRRLGFAIYGREPRSYKVDGRYYDQHLIWLDLTR